ncbi:MAG: quinone oxidoreductase [Chloroflexi bacterium]|nr:quinone oxidoreductase [Chloroflexota bacterium]
MKAIQVTRAGGPEVLTYTDVPDPQLTPGGALVRQLAIGVNFVEVYQRSGLYNLALPAILGSEGAGIVTAVAPGVTEVAVGDLVAYSGVTATYAETVVAPAGRLVKVPAGLDAEAGAAAMLQGMTAHSLSHSTYPLATGETALIHAGAGGVGLLLIQMAKRLGARVITTVSTPAKADLARAVGADHVILYTETDFRAEVMGITDGRGVQVVYDSVGRTTFDQSLASLAPRGYLVLFGQSSGPVPPQAPQILITGSYFLTRPSLQHYTATRGDLLWRANDVLGWVADGSLKLHIHDRFPLSDASEAHRQLESRATTGKLLLVP